MSALELRDVSKVYGEGANEVHALRGIDLAVDAGALVAVMGPSGSGKSTLLTIAGSLEVPSAGEVLIDGVTASTMSRDDRARLRRRSIGYVFQDFNLLAGLSALENVCLPMELDGIRARTARIAGMEALEELGLTDRASSFPDELSGGERQRVAIARAVVGDRHLLLADEPSGALDSANAEAVIRLIRAACCSAVSPAWWSPTMRNWRRGPTGWCSFVTGASWIRRCRHPDRSRCSRRKRSCEPGARGKTARVGRRRLGWRAGAARDLPLVVATVPPRVAPASPRGGADRVRGRGDDGRSVPRLQRRTPPRPGNGIRDRVDDVPRS